MKISKLILALFFMGAATFTNAQAQKKAEEICYNPNAKGDTSKRSLKSAAVGKIGDANVTINYYSPGVRKRVIWGGLVPYGEVWVTGAHSATNIEVDKALIIGGKTIPAGRYALFTIPGKSMWTIIINKNWNQHLTDDYDAKDDVVRIQAKPIKQNKAIERLQYFIKKQPGSKAIIAVGWDTQLVQFEAKAI